MTVWAIWAVWAFGLTSWLILAWITQDAVRAALGTVVTLIGAGGTIGLPNLVRAA